MSRFALATLLGGLALGAASCNPYDPDLGDEPFKCGTSAPTCPDGYEEEWRTATLCVCVHAGGASGDAGPQADGSVNTTCNDDSSFEPNEDFNDPTSTAIGADATTTIFNDMAICPGNDVDVFRMMIPEPGTIINVTVDFDAGGGDLAVDILNASGLSVASSAPPDGARVTAFTTASNAGTYYAQITSESGDDNNYDVRMQITLP